MSLTGAIKIVNWKGKKFGKLTAIQFSHKVGKKHYWVFRCECGGKKITQIGSVAFGYTKSCGCLPKSGWLTSARAKRIRKLNMTSPVHGMVGTRFYRIWSGILGRCNTPNNTAYWGYGSRGIKCLWKSFEEFKNDMYEDYIKHIQKFEEKNTSIDRIDSNGHYSKENCRWATPKEQAKNSRKYQNLIMV